MDLNEVERVTIRPGIAAGGNCLTRVPGPDGAPSSVILGIIPPEKAIYRFDFAARRLLDWRQFDGSVAGIARRDDGTLWLDMETATEPKSRVLVSLEPATMRWQNWGRLSRRGIMVWCGNELYLAAEGSLWRVALPAAPESTTAPPAR